MHYFLYPTKDTFITNDPSFMYKNMGLDEILEVEKNVIDNSCSGGRGASLSRAILQFDLTTISASIATGVVLNPKFYLTLKTAEAQAVAANYTLAAYPLSASWVMGTCYKYDGNPVSDGANWKFSDGVSAKWWVTESLVNCDGGGLWWVSASLLGSGSGYAQPPFVSPNPYDPYPFCTSTPTVSVTGTVTPTPTPSSGSAPTPTPTLSPTATSTPTPTVTPTVTPTITITTTPSATIGSSPTPTPSITPTTSLLPVVGGYAAYQNFTYRSSDVHMDITNIVNAWLSGALPNNGLIVLHSGEADSVSYGKLRFFSKETNTVYSPYIDMAWDDSYFNIANNTSSFDPININDAVVTIKNMASQYKYGSIIKFEVTGRTRYPVKTFTNKVSDYLEVFWLPYTTYYAIRDAETSEAIIPYDGYTRVSFDSSGNYFLFDTTGLPQERYFIISIRCEQSGTILTFDIPTTFKIVR